MSSDQRTVYLSTSATPALSEPQFVVEHDGRIYLTLAVAEYEADASELEGMLESGEPVRAVVYRNVQIAHFANTDRPPEV
jgi:hypothetical protein